MASTTTNLGLTKPAYTDDADVAVINANSDIIDAAYGSLSDQIANISTLTTGVVTWNTENVDGDVSRKNWFRIGRIVIASFEFTPLTGRIFHNAVLCSGLPTPFAGSGIFMYGGNTQQMTINSSGELCWYYPTDRTTLGRIDTTIVYIMQ